MMNRSIILSASKSGQHFDMLGKDYKNKVSDWTKLILARQNVVPDGHVFEWYRDKQRCRNTALMFDAVMTNLQYAQRMLQNSQVCVGKQSYRYAIEAAKKYQFVLQELLPKWTFIPAECAQLDDLIESDLFGHYCLSRAMAYDNVGKADLTATDSAQAVAACNAAHLFTLAAGLISGDNSTFLRSAMLNTAKVYLLHGEKCLQQWNDDADDVGAATALACFTEADRRFRTAGEPGCKDRMVYAHERNSVSWQQPNLPPWSLIGKPRITAL